jgi:mannose-6-phosphate isomerase
METTVQRADGGCLVMSTTEDGGVVSTTLPSGTRPQEDPRPMAPTWPAPMANQIRDYDWGSHTALATLSGREPSGRPEAELWMGAHPTAPSTVTTPGGVPVPLPDLIDADPVGILGEQVVARFGARLPFLLKILAIAEPLSVQVHPSAERAAQGFHARADEADAHRYVDPWAKPEMLYALEPVDALCGFRTVDRATEMLSRFSSPRLAQVAEALAGSGTPGTRLEAAFTVLVTWPTGDRAALVDEVTAETARLLATAPGAGDPGTCPDTAGPNGSAGGGLAPADLPTLRWMTRLAERYPGDPLVAAPLLLDLVCLEPGQTLFVPPGAPHAYLHGVGIEIMGNSDNVLRAGLTRKEIALGELLWVVDGRTRPEPIPSVQLTPTEVVWRPEVTEFQLSRIIVDGSGPVTASPELTGPQILLCVSGTVTAAVGEDGRTRLTPGESCFVGSGPQPLVLTGSGQVFRAAVGQDDDPTDR